MAVSKLYNKQLAILRHGEAESPVGFSGDAQRRLTPAGEKMSLNAANSLAPYYLLDQSSLAKNKKDQNTYDLEVIWYSPFVRTEATATIIYDFFKESNKESAPKLEATEYLLGENSASDVGQWLADSPYQRILLVSHQPLVANLTYWLTGQQSHFAPASFSLLNGEFIEQDCMELRKQVHQSN